MSYQVLARKWRPSTFAETVGQEAVLKALVHALDHNRVHHAYLFTGTRGVGKTSIARILAKCLNCEAGVTSVPCGECSACTSIAEGRFVDLIEVDAASRTRVEDTRELLDNVQYTPTVGRFKVYLIDEVHMLSSHSFNALLKTLEEPPEHVKFLLATTDPKRLPVTILSRCLQLHLKNIPAERIAEHLAAILTAEAVAHEGGALRLLARSAEGSLRDALSLTDQAIAFGSGEVRETDVRTMLGSVDHQAVAQLIQALAERDAEHLLSQVDELAQYGADFRVVLDELIGLLHQLAIAQVVPGKVAVPLLEGEALAHLAAQLTGEEVQLYYQFALQGRRDLPLSPDSREAFEMLLLRMLVFRPFEPPTSPNQGDGPAGRLEKKKPLTSEASAVREPAPASPSPDVAGFDRKEAGSAAAVIASNPEDAGGPVAAREPAGEVPRAAAMVHEPARSTDGSTGGSALNGAEPAHGGAGLTEDWVQLAIGLPLSGVARALALNAELSRRDGTDWCLRVDPSHSTLVGAAHQERIQEALCETTGSAIKLSVELGALSAETAAMYLARRERERHLEAVAALEADPAVQALVERFDARLVPESVQPVDGGDA